MNTNSRSVHKIIDQLLHALKMSILYCTLEDIRNLDMAMTNAYRVYYLQFLQENLSEYFMILLNEKSKDLTIRKDLFVIKYNYLDKSYNIIETKYNCDIIKLFNNIPNIAPPFSNIDLVYTSFAE